ncbi:tetratricopeptide repeat protein [Marinimicrobium alkaliphilum]|uniref:tetratricopeptide repeat protein n=1 Tax=Marinimicrobium alkaliphilum TaxID=2202654 RepID=UPI0018E0960F|nr:tetratricopeptide repeat protein [Marinimicrobium alkaliphilum]
MNRFNSGDFSGALFIFKRLAKEGCSTALVEVGNIYELGGGGIEKDVDKAIQWYNYSIESLDDPKAHLCLARAYLQRGKTDDDYRRAYEHLSLLEDSEEMGAFYGLGLMYAHGIWVPKDVSTAMKYYRKAYGLGHLMAFRNFAFLTMKFNPIKGGILWLKSCLKITRVASKNPYDPRLGMH